ncbi:MAG: energy-coupling factor transporter transmembrane protein EcfT [Eggerthellaceae bacterium]|nr:energy-coupling factor transporter transmembrane protein EcfT [Eggerthellaceae bacterium]
MPVNIATYNPKQTPIHSVDARVKIILVLMFSIVLFCVHSWWAIGLLACIALLCAFLARLEVGATLRSMLPVVLILAVTLIANSFVLDVRSYDPTNLPSYVSTGVFAQLPAIPLIGAFGFVPAGFIRGCFFVLRIVLLLVASLVLTTTTTSNELTSALRSFMRPLERLGFPTHDVATVVSIALRFIPVSIDEFHRIREAQTARGASFDTGGIIGRLRAWTTVLIPLLVGLYRRADNLALAMDARCYGAGPASQLVVSRLGVGHIILLVVGIFGLATIAFFG